MIEHMGVYLCSHQLPSRLGEIRWYDNDFGVAAIRFEDDCAVDHLRGGALIAVNGTPLPAQINEYLNGDRRSFDVSLDTRSLTPFQGDVLRYVLTIPYGETRTYGEVARAVGRPKAHRSAASVIAGNPCLIVIPCHRVVPSSGGIGKYAAGTDRKRELLDMERGN